MSTLSFSLIVIVTLAGTATSNTKQSSVRNSSLSNDCQWRYSCNGTSSSPKSETDLKNLNCYCDELCEIYDDCCEDYEPKVESVQLPKEVVDCRHLGLKPRTIRNESRYLESFQLPVHVVTRCPDGYQEDEFYTRIRILCELGISDTDIMIFRIPVTGRTTTILYRNRFCAMCNNEYDFISWIAELEIDTVFQLEEAISNITSKIPLQLTEIRFSFPEEYPPRLCKPVIQNCSIDWIDRGIAEKCENGSQLNAYVYLESGNENTTAFRNEYCATCNYVNNTTPGCTVYQSTIENFDFPAPRAFGIMSSLSSNNCKVMIRVHNSEYKILANSSAIVPKLAHFYNPGEYIHVPPNLFICWSMNETANTTASTKPDFDLAQSILTFVGLIISLVSLFVLFIIYMRYPVLRNIPGKCVICLDASLFVAHFSFLFIGSSNPLFCFSLSFIIHFAFLASFFWMSVLSFDICRTFASKTKYFASGSKSKTFIYYSIYAWLSPTVIVGVSLILDLFELHDHLRPHYGKTVCWITSRLSLIVFFLVPVATVLVSNFVMFGITIGYICRSTCESDKAFSTLPSIHMLIVFIKLSIIMGLTWVFGFLANLTQSTVLWYLFIIFNTLQGAFLCLGFVCTKKVFRLMWPKRYLVSRMSTYSSRHTRQSSVA